MNYEVSYLLEEEAEEDNFKAVNHVMLRCIVVRESEGKEHISQNGL